MTTRQVVVAGMLAAIVVVLGLTPAIGLVPVPTPAGSATTMHVPVILAGILEGPVVGGIVGFAFGAYSMWHAYTNPANPIARMMFSDPLVAFLPRILIGVCAYYAYAAVRVRWARYVAAATLAAAVVHGAYTGLPLVLGERGRAAWVVVAGVLGPAAAAGGFAALRGRSAPVAFAAILATLTNTVGVLSLCVLRGYIPAAAAFVVGVTHGLPECVVAVTLVTLLHRGIRRGVYRSGPGLSR